MEKEKSMLHWFGKRLRELQEKNRDERGFTLIELLVVVIIIGILAAIAIPTFLSQKKNAYEAQTKTDIRNAVTNAESFATTKNGSYTGMTAADVEAGNANKNSNLVVNVKADGSAYCIAGANKTDASVKFIYQKATDTIAANSGTNTCTAT